jgi:hypothetical protein
MMKLLDPPSKILYETKIPTPEISFNKRDFSYIKMPILSMTYTQKCFRENILEESASTDYVFYLSMALQPLLDLGRFFSFLIYTQSVELLGMGISTSQGRYLHTEQHKHIINAHRHLCLESDSNPRSQCSSGKRHFMPQTARPLWPACLCIIQLNYFGEDKKMEKCRCKSRHS